MELKNKDDLKAEEKLTQKKSKYAATYVFDIPEEKRKSEVTIRIWQIFPSVCASLVCIPFGMMLGWPSPTYPKLLALNSPIPISMDQSAMIAGFLMIGNIIGTPFSTKSIFCSKYGVILSAILMAVGWIVMWQACDIYGLLGSRLLVGGGYGYGLGQLKEYIKEMCEEELAMKLTKQIHFYCLFGVVLSFCIGPFADYGAFLLTGVIISVFVVFLSIFLPSTPRELIKSDKIDVAKKLLLFLKPNANLNEEIKKIYDKMDSYEGHLGFSSIIKNAVLRKNFLIFFFLSFFQQFTGAPATLIYTQILFRESLVPYEVYFAIFYILIFYVASILGVFVMPNYNKKSVLLISNLGVIFMDIIKIIVIYFYINKLYWSYTSVVVMYLFIIFHTIGLGSIPFSMIGDLFPKNCRLFVTLFFIMFTSAGALVITKIFQVLLDQFNVYVPFCLFLSVSTVSVIFISVFIPKKLR